MHQNVLLVSQDAPKSSTLETILCAEGYAIHHALLDTALVNQDILKKMKVINPDFVAIYTKKPQSSMLETIRMIQDKQPAPIIIFAEERQESIESDVINAGASAFIVDGIEEHRMRSIIEVAKTRFLKCQTLKQKLSETEQKLTERKDIDRAKGIIMKNKNVSEDEAYKMLRSLAMTKNQRMGELAISLISASELLD